MEGGEKKQGNFLSRAMRPNWQEVAEKTPPLSPARLRIGVKDPQAPPWWVHDWRRGALAGPVISYIQKNPSKIKLNWKDTLAKTVSGQG